MRVKETEIMCTREKEKGRETARENLGAHTRAGERMRTQHYMHIHAYRGALVLENIAKDVGKFSIDEHAMKAVSRRQHQRCLRRIADEIY